MLAGEGPVRGRAVPQGREGLASPGRWKRGGGGERVWWEWGWGRAFLLDAQGSFFIHSFSNYLLSTHLVDGPLVG